MEVTSPQPIRSIQPTPEAFTRDRVRSILQQNIFQAQPGLNGGLPPPMICHDFQYSWEDGVHHYYSKEEQSAKTEEFCRQLYAKAEDVVFHTSQLDDCLSRLVVCNFQLQEQQDKEFIIDHTCHLLSRLPSHPIELDDDPGALHNGYLRPSTATTCNDTGSSVCLWQRLKVTTFVSTNVIRAAMLTIINKGRGSSTIMLISFIDMMADLLETCSRLSKDVPHSEAQGWYIARAFLWTSWQRCSMIYFHTLLAYYLKSGFNDHAGGELSLRCMMPSPDVSIQELSKRRAKAEKSAYMCGWAFELLRNHPVTIGVDFRRFHQRFAGAFGYCHPRCIATEPRACKGDIPGNCQRFRGMNIENQSAHDNKCAGNCPKMLWDEASYRSLSGARAVSLEGDHRDDALIKYCPASPSTLAISHVWSHGQGGRPEVGFNRCLHLRYRRIAQSFGCDSYWMDTPCIPDDHELRNESISKINDVFTQSKVTLVCDRDLMQIDARHLTLEVQESILVAVTVCDWNVRAWTFLEAFRARSAIHILCKDNVVVPLKETLKQVHEIGAIEVDMLALTLPHLLPSAIGRDFNISSQRVFVPGFLTLETAGSLLSHREASRPGDDLVIWSLLLKEEVCEDAEVFWRSRIGTTVSTAYLISSAPRLDVRGFSWAPRTPNADLSPSSLTNVSGRILSYDGSDGDRSFITSEGLRGEWFMYLFIGGNKRTALSRLPLVSKTPRSLNLRIIRKRYLRRYTWGALLRPVSAYTSRSSITDRQDMTRVLLVVCGSPGTDDDKKPMLWDWRGVYQWDMTEPLPKLDLTSEVFIV
ncbi:MAG: hypothetical protein Q9214_002051 [Letrouitia sp. 1 TL-2023]